MPDLTDAEVDELLERFDQTDPALQRRIVAAFAAKAALADELAETLTDCAEFLRKAAEAAPTQTTRGVYLLACDKADAALAKYP